MNPNQGKAKRNHLGVSFWLSCWPCIETTRKKQAYPQNRRRHEKRGGGGAASKKRHTPRQGRPRPFLSLRAPGPPAITRPRRALVIITLRRRQSARNPTLPRGLLRTALNKISSFSPELQGRRRHPVGRSTRGYSKRGSFLRRSNLGGLHQTTPDEIGGTTSKYAIGAKCHFVHRLPLAISSTGTGCQGSFVFLYNFIRRACL